MGCERGQGSSLIRLVDIFMGDVDSAGPELDLEGESSELPFFVLVDESDELHLRITELSLSKEAIALAGLLALGHGLVGNA